MTKEALKLCKDCKHYEAYEKWCDHPVNGICEVYGHTRAVWVSEMREDSGACGVEGKLWEPKKPWYKFWS